MGGSKKPKTPDPSAIIDAAIEANRVGQITPYGQFQFGSVDEDGVFNPNTDREVGKVTLNPDQQAMFDAQQEIARNLALSSVRSVPTPGAGLDFVQDRTKVNLPLASTLFDGGPVDNPVNAIRSGEDIETKLGDFDRFQQRVVDATYDLGRSKLDPEFADERRRTVTDLDARGLPVGGEAYSGELDRLERSQGERTQNLLNSSILSGSQQSLSERQQQLGEQLGIGGFEAERRAQTFGENTARFDRANQQNQFLGQFGLQQVAAGQNQDAAVQRQISMALNGGQLPAGNINPVPIPGIDTNSAFATAQSGANAGSNAKGGAKGGIANAAGTIGASAIEFSDRRLKQDIEHIDTIDGIKVYEFAYKHVPSERYIGVMADEVEHIDGAVIYNEDGYAAVNYGVLPVDFKEVV